MSRRALFVIVVLALLTGCASHSSALPPNGGGSVSPFVNQGQGQSRWLTFTMSQNVAAIARGHDDALWMTGANQIVRVDMSGNEHDFSLNGSPNSGPLTPNPDGNIYFAEILAPGFAIGQITSAGVVADFPLGSTTGCPSTGIVQSMVSGSDGNIWMVRCYSTQNTTTAAITRMTTSGLETDFLTGAYQVGDIQRGPDKNLWVMAFLSAQQFFMLKVSVVDGSYTAYPIPSDAGVPAVGSDGAFWMGSRSGNMYRMDTSGNVTTYPTGLQALVGPTVSGPNKKIYIAENNTKLYEWSIPKLRISQIKSPAPRTQPITALAVGPDDQLWADDGHTNVYVLILHAIVTTPSSVDVQQGSAQPLSVSEKKSAQQSFTAISNDPSIATVSGNGKAFTVTGVSHGTTTITVSDQIGNSLDVLVTVQ